MTPRRALFLFLYNLGSFRISQARSRSKPVDDDVRGGHHKPCGVMCEVPGPRSSTSSFPQSGILDAVLRSRLLWLLIQDGDDFCLQITARHVHLGVTVHVDIDLAPNPELRQIDPGFD